MAKDKVLTPAEETDRIADANIANELDNIPDEQDLQVQIEMESEMDEEDAMLTDEDEDGTTTTTETVITGAGEGAPSAIDEAINQTKEELEKAKADLAAQAPNGEAKKKYSDRMKEAGLDPSLGVPQELADMMRAAAKAQGDISVASWYRLAWANAVNAANLQHEVTVTNADGTTTVTTELWQFDVTKLEQRTARTSTAHLSPEDKLKTQEKKKAEQKEERTLIAELLAAHRAKLAGGRVAPAQPAETLDTSTE